MVAPMFCGYFPVASLLVVLSLFSLLALAETVVATDEKKVAVIGGSIGGTFAARFLAEFDAPCILSAVDVFDPSTQLTGAQSGTTNPSSGSSYSEIDRQGPRVSTLTLEDGSAVELGASIIFAGNRLITEQVNADATLEMAPPGSTGKEAASDPGGFGVYDGSGVWDIIVRDDEPDWKVALRLAWKYNFDLIKMRNAVKDAFASFEKVYSLLDDSSAYLSPDDMWKAVGLFETTTMSFEEYLDTIGISGSKAMRKASRKSSEVEWSWWRAAVAEFLPAWDSISKLLLPGHGSLRRELLDSVNINNYNQNNSQLDGLAGLVSFIPTQGDIYCIRGGNDQILSSAFRRAEEIHAARCSSNKTRATNRATENGSNGKVFHRIKATVTSIVFDSDRVEIWGNGNADSVGASTDVHDPVLLGIYDIAILAAPLQHAGIVFKEKDAAGSINLLKLGGLVRNDAEVSDHGDSGPSSTNRKYVQTVTTIVSNATLQHDSFGLSAEESIPRAISMTARGKGGDGFSALSRLSGADGAAGMFKNFSAEPLTKEQLSKLFGSHYIVKHEKVWGGSRGGAYPDFAGGGEAVRSAPFMLHGDEESDSPALYYVNAIEATVSAMEVSAIGAKAVAKLAAQRMGMTERPQDQKKASA